jgi:hypothetical protein
MNRSLFRSIALGLIGLIAVAGCSSSSASEEVGCKPGKMLFCRCADRAAGTKTCNADGKTYGECDCGNPEPEIDGSGMDAPEDYPPSGGTGGTGGSGTNPSPEPPEEELPTDVAPTCNKLDNIGDRLATANVSDEPTEALGGAIKSGTYVQTWMVYFRGENDARDEKNVTSSQTIEIGDKVGRLTVKDGSSPAVSAGFTFLASDNKLTMQAQCPKGDKKTLFYSASAHQLVIYDGPWARYFELQGTTLEEGEASGEGEGEEQP